MSDWVIGKLIPPVDPVPLSPVDERGLLVRLRLTALEAGHVLLAVPALVLLIAILVSWPLAPIMVGLLIARGGGPAGAVVRRPAPGGRGPRAGGARSPADYRPDGRRRVRRPALDLAA